MAQIGDFTRTETGYSGRIRTLGFDVELAIVPAEPSDAENAPDFRVHIGQEDGPEIGAGWKRVGEKAGDYVSLAIDDPALPQPIRANLFRTGADGNGWSLHWNRPSKRAERD
ncbi:DUF736 domain-containing protein [Inquilinus sp. CAU 1745]|uniref:DUF736 domain-containing protein n=1 Tax=Inquilinus sp. CAU 1745 TaxID=3140369 RepID=UPI00325B5928